MVRIQSPGGDPLRYSSKPPPEPMAIKPKPTFDCYSNPKGPDIKLNNMGPEYNGTQYQYKEYKLKPLTPYKPRPISSKDPLKSKPMYVDKPVGLYKGDVTYRLNENNNAGMRHWNYGFVEDTVAAKRSNPRPKDKYSVQERPKPARAKPEERPPVTVLGPMKRTPPPTPPPPLPLTKSYKSSSTQHTGPAPKTTTTQTQVSKTKSTSVQTESSVSHLPVVAPLPIIQSPKKVSTKSKGIQCSESPKKTVVRGTQSDGPTSHTSPVVVAKARKMTPHYAEQAQVTSEQHMETRRTPSQKVVENPPTQTAQQPKSTKVFISPIEHKPEVTSYPDYSAASQSYNKPVSGMFPYKTANSRLPPEITACIEAYDIAHGPM